jgi:serine/threonine protein kinase
MSLAAGSKLGPYEIISLIGKGGMCEVYRAHDTRLRSDVAIKISAAKFSQRFEREAHDALDAARTARASPTAISSPAISWWARMA